jgi:hypothetical protein
LIQVVPGPPSPVSGHAETEDGGLKTVDYQKSIVALKRT